MKPILTHDHLSGMGIQTRCRIIPLINTGWSVRINSLIFLIAIILLQTTTISGQTEYIAISKSGPAVALPGSLISYTISVGNGGIDPWTGIITDILPDEFTYLSSDPVADNVSSTTLTWNSFTVGMGENRSITVRGYVGRPGTTFSEPRYPQGYYMINSNSKTSITNSVSMAYGNFGGTLLDNHTTEVTQICSFYFGTINGQIKMSTNATFQYMVVVQNTGNVWDRYEFFVNPDNPEYASCTNPDGTSNTTNQKLGNAILDEDGNPITHTPWMAPGATYVFYLKLTSLPGTSANRWNCTDLRVTSEISEQSITKTFHTATINPPNEPNLYIYKIDYPDPARCGDTLKYSIHLTNLGSREAFNVVVTENYNSFVEFLSSSPSPDAGTNNQWSVANLPINGYASITVKALIREGVFNNQQILNEITATYFDGAQTPVKYTKITNATTTVNAFPDLNIFKSASADRLKLGETITYTLQYSNMGCGIATDVVIVDDYDDEHLIITDAAGGIVADGKITWNIGEVSSQGGLKSLTYSAEVTNVNCGAVQVQNNAFISSSEPDQRISDNSSSISILATTAPTWSLFPGDITTECNAVPEPATIGQTAELWAVDACGREVTISYIGEIRTDGNCPGNYSLTRTWRALDEFGNFSERSQVLNIQDNNSPEIFLPSFEGFNISGTSVDLTVFLEATSGSSYVVNGSIFNIHAVDNCTPSPVVNYTLSGATIGSGTDLNGVSFNKGITLVSWFATDNCNNNSSTSFSVNVSADPSLSITKILLSINESGETTEYSAVDDIIKYGFTIGNTGNVTLSNIVLTDPLATIEGGPLTLAPGESNNTTFIGTRRVTQQDLDSGRIINVATVSGISAGGLPAEGSDELTVTGFQNGSITIVKTSSTTPNTYDAPGDVLTFDIMLTNTGNVTLSSLTISDQDATITESAVTSLVPGSSVTITGTHTVTQADLDAGSFRNTATVNALTPSGATIIASDETTVTATMNPLITIGAVASVTNYNSAGDIVEFTFTLSNAGNVTLSNLVTISGHSVSPWNINTLAPGETVSYMNNYTITQADLDAGSLTVAVTSNGRDLFDTPVTGTATVTLLAIQEPSLELTMSSDPEQFIHINGKITYTITTTNDGNITLDNILQSAGVPTNTSFTDAVGAMYSSESMRVSWLIQSLAPGESVDNTMILNVDGDTEYETVIQNIASAEVIQTGIVQSNTVNLTVLNFPTLQTVSVSDVACYGTATGSVTVAAHEGLPPYSVLWNTVPAQSGMTAINLLAGDYRATVTDAMGHSFELNVTVNQPEAPLSITKTITDNFCHGALTGAVNLFPTGGTMPYTYHWNNNAVTRDINGVLAGEYSVIVTDANGCTATTSATIDEPELPIAITDIKIVGVECIDDPFGSITFDVSGGIAPYSYKWDTGETTMYRDNIGGGNYNLTITDNLGCVMVHTFSVDYNKTDCGIRVPEGITPYGQFDTKLIIRGLENYPVNSIKIFNRYGGLVYEASPYSQDWDGVPNKPGNLSESDGKVPSGTYYYILETVQGRKPHSGYIYLIKN